MKYKYLKIVLKYSILEQMCLVTFQQCILVITYSFCCYCT